MADKLSIEVKQTSYETLKPSNPTPCDHKSLTLSYIDQNFPSVHLPLLLIYARRDDEKSSLDIITSLKTSLCDALVEFYPLAGRCNDHSTVLCNDQGVPFFETFVECNLTHVLNNPNKLDLMSKLLPPTNLFTFGQLLTCEVHPLVFQVNLFKCGGLVIGCYMLHKLLDASSISTFFNYWAALASQKGMGLMRPNFNAAVTTFPPVPVLEEKNDEGKGGDSTGGAGVAMMWRRLKAIKVVARSFTFDNVAINKLKDEAKSEKVPNPTSFEAVVGFVWKSVVPGDGPSVLSFNANIRPRTNPPLPKETIGNLLVGAHSSVEKCGNLTDFVKEIHYEVSCLDQKIENLKGKNGLDYFLKYREGNPLNGKATKYNLSSWCKFGLNRVNFGFGNPTKVIPYGMVHPLLRNSIMLVDYSDRNGDGIEAWLFLEESEMQNLESNSKFLGFASPS